MFDVALHAGTEHPSLVSILVPSILTFLAGFVIGHTTNVGNWARNRLTTAD